MNILTIYFTASSLFTFVREGMVYIEFNSITLFTILYLQFLNFAKDVSKVTVQPTILEYLIKHIIFTLFRLKYQLPNEPWFSQMSLEYWVGVVHVEGVHCSLP